MKILFIVPYVPSLIRSRSYNIIQKLAARGHSITLGTLVTHEQDQIDLERIKPSCSQLITAPLPRWRSLFNSVTALPTSHPLQYAYCWQPKLAKLLWKCIQNDRDPYDVIHVEHLRGARYGEYLKKRFQDAGMQIPIVWDSVDCISLLFQLSAEKSSRHFTRLLSSFELIRTKSSECRLMGSFNHTVITSPVDRKACLSLNQDCDETSITVISHGVDVDYFQPARPEEIDPKNLVLSGKMSYHANVEMAHFLVERIMPLIWATHPEISLTIVGKDPPKSILDMAANPALRVTGTVPDIRPYLHKAALAVVPMQYGVGIQNKVLEAMACGVPVVASPQVLSALSAVPEQDLLIADDPQEFANQVLALLEHPQRRAAVGKAGRLYVEAEHRWEIIVERLERIYTNVIE